MTDVKMQVIAERREKLDGECNLLKDYTDRQGRLKRLVAKHGFDAVALASGLSEITVRQYCRTRMPTTIAERPVFEAETVLKGL